MSKKLYEETDIQSVANAIREKNGLTTNYKVSDMAQAIKDIPSGGSGATEPYREDTINSSKNEVIESKLYGYSCIPSGFFSNYTYLTKVISSSPVTSIKAFAFDQCISLTSIDLSKVTSIGSNAFTNCSKLVLTELPPLLTDISASAFRFCTSITINKIGDNVTRIDSYGLGTCNGITELTIPSKCTTINKYAITNCANLTKIKIESAVNIANYGLNSCNKLQQVIFTQKANSLATNAFSSCTALTDIKVSWSEGEVTGAPWGATNATITYNYTGE